MYTVDCGEPIMIFWQRSNRNILYALGALSLAVLACGPLNLVREILAPSDVWYVAIGGNDGNSCRSETEACASIEAAVDKADVNGEIRILAGRYRAGIVHIDKNLRLIGAGSDTTTVAGEGRGTSPIFFLGASALEDIPAPSGGASIFLSGMTLEQGHEGVLWNDGVTSILSDLRVRNTEGTTWGAIRNFAGSQLNMIDVHIDGITVTARGGCSAIENKGIMDLRESTITGGSGGRAAICNSGTGIITIARSEISGNRSSALMVGENSTARVGATLIIANESSQGGGAIYNLGSLSLTTSMLRDNRTPTHLGGGIFNTGEMSITRSTLSGNEALEAGGIYNDELAFASLVNTTISGNRALDGNAGGIYTLSTMELDFTTVAFNDPIGLVVDVDHPSPSVQRSVFASNRADDCAVQISASAPGVALLDAILSSLGHNLDSDNRCGLDSSGDRAGVDPRLEPLADNGGPVLTHALGTGSPAIDSAGSCEAVDARNISRPQGGDCDMGAYEVDLSPFEGTRVPTSGDFHGQPAGPVNCRSGPGVVYRTVAYFDVGDELSILARDPQATWLQVQEIDQPTCWINRDLLDIDPVFNLMDLPPGTIPPTPTRTPVPATEKPDTGAQGCWHQGQNDNQPLCYLPCPPQPNPGGACTP
jgi:hypothetical protein